MKKDEVKLKVDGLKEYLISLNIPNSGIKCFRNDEDCNECYLFVDGNITKQKIKLNLTDVKVYNFDIEGNELEVKFGKYRTDVMSFEKEICLDFRLFKNFSSSNYILENGGEYILFFSSYHKPFITKDFEEAKELFLEQEILEKLRNL